MSFTGPNTQFKITARSFRQLLFSLGFSFREVYNRLVTFKLRKNLYTFTITALSTATTAGSQYTTPNAQVFTVQATAAAGATSIQMACETGTPDAASSTLTYVTSSSGTLGTHQATIAYSAVSNTPACLGPYEQLQEPVTVRSQL